MEEHQSVCFLMGTQNISLSHACDKTKNIFIYFFTKLKTYYLSYSICKIVNFANFSWHVSGDQPLMIWFFYFIVK